MKEQPADLALLMANQAKAAPGAIILDPFAGTGEYQCTTFDFFIQLTRSTSIGSLLVACAKYGAFTMGSDLDYRVLHGLKGSFCFMLSLVCAGPFLLHSDDQEIFVARMSLTISTSTSCPCQVVVLFVQGRRKGGLLSSALELVLSDNSHPVWRPSFRFDAIVCDPPYGVRAGARKSGTSKQRQQKPCPPERK